MRVEFKEYIGEKQNQVIIDYLTLTVHQVQVLDLLEIFCKFIENQEIIPSNFTLYEYGTLKGYDTSYRFLGENIINFNFSTKLPERMGVNINISGQGLKLINLNNLIEFVKHLELKNIKYNCTRLDLAFDDFNNTIPKQEIIEDLEQYALLGIGEQNNTNCLTRIKNTSIQFYSGAFNKIQYKNVTFGSRKGTFFARMYDKRAEQQYTNIDYYERFELELRQDRAQYVLLKLMQKQELSILFVELLCSGIKFINADKYQGKERDVKKVGLKLYFQQFLEEVSKIKYEYKKIKYQIKQTTEYFLKKVNYVYNQLGTLLSAIHQTNSKVLPSILSECRKKALNHDKYSYYIKNCKKELIIQNPFITKQFTQLLVC